MGAREVRWRTEMVGRGGRVERGVCAEVVYGYGCRRGKKGGKSSRLSASATQDSVLLASGRERDVRRTLYGTRTKGQRETKSTKPHSNLSIQAHPYSSSCHRRWQQWYAVAVKSCCASPSQEAFRRGGSSLCRAASSPLRCWLASKLRGHRHGVRTTLHACADGRQPTEIEYKQVVKRSG